MVGTPGFEPGPASPYLPHFTPNHLSFQENTLDEMRRIAVVCGAGLGTGMGTGPPPSRSRPQSLESETMSDKEQGSFRIWRCSAIGCGASKRLRLDEPDRRRCPNPTMPDKQPTQELARPAGSTEALQQEAIQAGTNPAILALA